MTIAEKLEAREKLNWKPPPPIETLYSIGPLAIQHLQDIAGQDRGRWDLDGYSITMLPEEFAVEETQINCQLSNTYQRLEADDDLFSTWFQVISSPVVLYAPPEFRDPLHRRIHETQESIFFLLHDNPKLFIKGNQHMDMKVLLDALTGISLTCSRAARF